MDKIAEIIKNHSSYMINGAAESAAKQIRQQIGRELLATINQPEYYNSVPTYVIREVCQLGEEE